MKRRDTQLSNCNHFARAHGRHHHQTLHVTPSLQRVVIKLVALAQRVDSSHKLDAITRDWHLAVSR